jgi:hypothetical protein
MIAGVRGRFADFGYRDIEAIGFSERQSIAVRMTTSLSIPGWRKGV